MYQSAAVVTKCEGGTGMFLIPVGSADVGNTQRIMEIPTNTYAVKLAFLLPMGATVGVYERSTATCLIGSACNDLNTLEHEGETIERIRLPYGDVCGRQPFILTPFSLALGFKHTRYFYFTQEEVNATFCVNYDNDALGDIALVKNAQLEFIVIPERAPVDLLVELVFVAPALNTAFTAGLWYEHGVVDDCPADLPGCTACATINCGDDSMIPVCSGFPAIALGRTPDTPNNYYHPGHYFAMNPLWACAMEVDHCNHIPQPYKKSDFCVAAPVYNAGTPTSGVPGSYSVCWSHGAGGADFGTPIDEEFGLYGPLPSQPFACTIGELCEVTIVGLGLDVSNELRIIESGECATGTGIAATWGLENIHHRANPVESEAVAFLNPTDRTTVNADANESVFTLGTPQNPAVSGYHYKLCWDFDAKLAAGGQNYIVDITGRLGTVVLNGPFTFEFSCTLGQECRGQLEGIGLSEKNRLALLEGGDCGDVAPNLITWEGTTTDTTPSI
jgi:hypothetical protein